VGPSEQLSASEAHLAPDPAVAQRTAGSPANECFWGALMSTSQAILPDDNETVEKLQIEKFVQFESKIDPLPTYI
jgi:hypothetical protein